MVDVAISIAGKVAEMLVEPIWRQICYPFKYKTNMEELKKQVEKLRNQREVVQHSVDAAKRQGHEIEKLVNDWMKSVDEFADEIVKPITDSEEKAAGKFCFTLGTRYFLSRRAVKATNEISLLGDGVFQNVSYRPDIRRTKSVLSRGFEDFCSRMSVFEEIMKALGDEGVYCIGVWGMGGVGKTTLAKRVAAQVMEEGLFGRVVFAEVSQTADVEKLQKQIADELDMKLDKESVSGKAIQIHERLKNETSVLLILDNIWEKLDLDAIGIPVWNDIETSFMEEEIEPAKKIVSNPKMKMLLTSRDLDVLRGDMNSQKNFFVDTLSDSEASDLFWKTVNYAKRDVDLDLIATEVVRKCAGLPIAITTIASALKNKDLLFWKDALKWLEASNPKPIKGMEKSVYSTIELSYNVLGPEEQSLFLLCALDEAGFGLWINDLIWYSIGLNLFENVATMEDARIRMHTLLTTLKTSSLLLDGKSEGWVKMHDIIRAVGVSIASSDKLMFNIPSNARIREMLEDKLPKDSTMVSYQYGDIKELPEVLEFPNLQLFNLYPKELGSVHVPDTLFDNAQGLRVLYLTKFDLPFLPASVVGLKNLRTLGLAQCLLRDLAIIGQLKMLEILSFLESELEQLPREIGQLSRLRVLDLRGCSKLKIIPPNVLSNLTRLEELYLCSFVEWDVNGQQNASLGELKKLVNLSTLEIHVLEGDIIPLDLFFRKLKTYKILIGDVWKGEFENYESSRILKLKLNNSFNLNEGIKFLLKKVEYLHLDEPKGAKNVLQALNVDGFQELKHLHIQNAPQIKYISGNSVEWRLCNVLPQKLESLVLQNLMDLEMICGDQLEPDSFGQLKTIKIERCHKLKNMILPIVGHLSQLEKIKVSDCSKLEEIVFIGGKELHNDLQQSSITEFRELRSIKLEWLPCLSKFGFIISENNTNDFKSFFNQNVLLPKLKKLKLWCIDFRCCENIAMKKCIFSFPTVRSFRRLEKLLVSDCEEVEAILDSECMGEEISKEMIFQSLKVLNLCRLPKFERLCLHPRLEEKVSLFSMTVLGMHSISSKLIWHNQLLNKSSYLHNLRHLNISGLDDLKYLFTCSVVNSLSQLQSLKIQNCKFMEVLVVEEKDGSSYVKFPNLNTLHLHDLPILTVFSNYIGNSIDMSLLSKLWIKNCPKMEIFISNSHDIDMLPRIGCAEIDTNENFQHTVQPFFNEKVILSHLNELKLEQMDNVKQIWQNQLHLDFSNKLEILHVSDCHKISSIFPFNMLGRLQNLNELRIKGCDSMEEIFELESQSGGNKTHDVAAPQLKIIWLEKLPKLKHVWNMDSRIILSFRNLQSLRVQLCDSLKSLFPAFIAKGLEKLETLYVRDCMMEKIIAMEDEVEAVSEFLFPQLRSFELIFLSKLENFCSGLYISKWPVLEKLMVWRCSRVKILTSEFQSHRDNPLDTCGGPLFLVDKVAFPSLNRLEVNWNCIANEILHDRFPLYSYKVHTLALEGPYTESAICPSCFLSEWSKIGSLYIYNGYLKELFLSEQFVCAEKHSELPSQLTYLELCRLTDQVFWNAHPQFDKLFQDLTTLEVYNCNELVSLVVSSTAKSLKHLTKLWIVGCIKIEEIISDVEDEIDDCIFFNQLKFLGLHALPNLGIFYSGSCKIEFPCLQEVVVNECPNLKKFSPRDSSTPKLNGLQITHSLQTGEVVECWKGDINTTMEQCIAQNGESSKHT